MDKRTDSTLGKMGFISGVRGSVLLSEPAKELFENWIDFLSSALAPYYKDSMLAPTSISKEVLIRSKYFKHFPHQLFAIKQQGTSDESGDFLNPAACLHVYEHLARTSLDRRASIFILAQCARTEDLTWIFPFRLSHFHMAELVIIGREKAMDRQRKEIQSLLLSIFDRFNIPGNFESATDAFFLGNEEGAKVIQKLKGLKQEFRAHIGDNSIALASINNHEQYFGKCFTIKNGKEAAFSFCVAFGIERLTAYGLLKWGSNKKNWPKELQR